jgi:hypothetical protein
MPRSPYLLAFGFGVAFVSVLLALAVAVPNPTDQQFEIFRIVLALAVAGVAAVVPGMLKLQLGHAAGFALSAGGALAVFVVVYFYSPARWATSKQEAGPAPSALAPNGNANSGVNNGSMTVNTR